MVPGGAVMAPAVYRTHGSIHDQKIQGVENWAFHPWEILLTSFILRAVLRSDVRYYYAPFIYL